MEFIFDLFFIGIPIMSVILMIIEHKKSDKTTNKKPLSKKMHGVSKAKVRKKDKRS